MNIGPITDSWNAGYNAAERNEPWPNIHQGLTNPQYAEGFSYHAKRMVNSGTANAQSIEEWPVYPDTNVFDHIIPIIHALGTLFTVQATTQREERLKATANMEAFKTKVANIAMDYAIDNDWCEVVEEALESMGIDIPNREVTCHVTVDFTVTGVAQRGNRQRDMIDFFQRSINQADLGLDGDWENCRVHDWDIIEVSEVCD